MKIPTVALIVIVLFASCEQTAKKPVDNTKAIEQTKEQTEKKKKKKETTEVGKDSMRDRRSFEEKAAKPQLDDYDEPHIKLNPDRFNQSIQGKTLKDPPALMEAYLDYGVKHRGKVSISQELLDDGYYLITALNLNVPKTEKKTEKIILLAAKTGNDWDVNEIRRNWQCGTYNSRAKFDVSSCK